jgi:GATA-binding protein
MNLDDFIVPSSMGTPAGISPAPSSQADVETSSIATTGAIPINKRQQQILEDELHLSRASAPSGAPIDQGRSNQEFDYVPRHVRKTSIDERKVCYIYDEISTVC